MNASPQQYIYIVLFKPKRYQASVCSICRVGSPGIHLWTEGTGAQRGHSLLFIAGGDASSSWLHGKRRVLCWPGCWRGPAAEPCTHCHVSKGDISHYYLHTCCSLSLYTKVGKYLTSAMTNPCWKHLWDHIVLKVHIVTYYRLSDRDSIFKYERAVSTSNEL